MREYRRAFAAFFALAFTATAHDFTRSEAKIEAHGDTVRTVLTLNLAGLDSRTLAHPLRFDATGRITSAQLDAAIPAIFGVAERHYAIRAAGVAPLTTALQNYVLVDGHVVRMEILSRFPSEVTALEITSTLYEIMSPGHRHLMNVTLNGVQHEAILDASTRTASFSGVATTRFETFLRFTRLGVEHIFTGYDHLAFLLGLLIATATLGSLIEVITSFTVAHSITLALATFNVIALPARLTESAIAISIGYIALENLLGFRAVKRRYITFFFGLIHGFGFSSVLREMDLPRSGLALSLFSFNFGVEIGQLIFVLMLFPLVRDLTDRGWKNLQPAVSCAIGCLAVWWFVRRAFFF